MENIEFKISIRTIEKFEKLLVFYKSLTTYLNEVYPYQKDCGTCNKCCCYPYFYMIMYSPEFELIQAFIEENSMPVRVKFDKLVSRNLDKRVYYKSWVCPLYDHGKRKCSIYPVRPFSCRVFGAYSTLEGQIDGCVFDNQIIYKFTDELPFWNDYVSVLKSFPDPYKGYILPDSMLWQYPVVELLMETDLPFSLTKNYEPSRLTFEEVEKRLGYCIAAHWNDILKDYKTREEGIMKKYDL